MFITGLRASGYRNLDGLILLAHPLAVLVGENNAGKSNVIDALRTVLEPDAGPHARYWIRPDDFAHDGAGARTTMVLELELLLGALSDDESARMVTCLTPRAGPGTAKLRLRATLGTDDRVTIQWFGGESQHADVDRWARGALRFAYLHPLRDAAADLRPGRDNRLVALLSALAPDGHPDRAAIVDAAQQANDALDTIPAVDLARNQIALRLAAMTGYGRFRQHTGLAFEDPRFDRVVAALRAKIGQFAALDMAENGLGFNNLLYMAVLLAALTEPRNDQALRVLLVEEPEAHLHPQLQDLLMRFLETEAGDGTQVVATTHSPHFASSARVERMTVVSRQPAAGGQHTALPRDFGLSDRQLRYLHRFLDVTKAALFFARGVVLVEGISEQLLLPVFATRLGRPLEENGITLINVGGVAFPPFAELFGQAKLRYPLAVVSDSDAQPDPDDLEGAAPELSPRAADLANREGDNVIVRLAERTFEWDLANAGNAELMIEILGRIKPRVATRLATLVANGDVTPADGILEAVKDIKGRYAQELADTLSEDPETPFAIPGYLREAIEWVTEPAVG